MKPPKPNILNPEFRYTNAASTDLKKKFEAIRRELAKEQRTNNVRPLKKKQ